MNDKLILEITEYNGVQQALINGLRISKNKPMSESSTIMEIELDHEFLLSTLGAVLNSKISVGVKDKIF